VVVAKTKNKLDCMQADFAAMTTELDVANRSTCKFFDSSVINSTPQRFLTKYIRARLTEAVKEGKSKLENQEAEYQDVMTTLRRCEREMRATRRELDPLTKGLVIKVKLKRNKRLRAFVRSQKRGATELQRLWRGYALRKAMRSPFKSYWIECIDEETSQPYFFNTTSEGTTWHKPLEMTLYEKFFDPSEP
jgi:hypothetical protein